MGFSVGGVLLIPGDRHAFCFRTQAFPSEDIPNLEAEAAAMGQSIVAP